MSGFTKLRQCWRIITTKNPIVVEKSMVDQVLGILERSQSGEKTRSNWNYLGWFATICVVIVHLTFGYFHIYGGDLEKRGSFGDVFGGLNAVFSGFAFAGVIITIFMQMKELQLTRKELIRQSDAQKNSARALEKQLENMRVSSKLEAIRSFVDSRDPEKQLDESEIGNAVLAQLTKKIFEEGQFAHLMRPDLKKSNYLESMTQFYTEGKKETITRNYKFVNNGASFMAKGLTVIDENDEVKVFFVTEDDKFSKEVFVPRNKRVEFIMEGKPGTEFKVAFQCHTKFVKHTWGQLIEFTLNADRVRHILYPAQLIKNDRL